VDIAGATVTSKDVVVRMGTNVDEGTTTSTGPVKRDPA
jgi:hypothetical protein